MGIMADITSYSLKEFSRSGSVGVISTSPSQSQTAMDRAISDLRRGAMVILRDTETRMAAIIQAAEMVTSDGLRMLTHLTGSQPTVAITRNRATALKGSAPDSQILSIALPIRANASLVRQIVDPTFKLEKTNTPNKAANFNEISIVPEPTMGLADLAIKLVKYARLLPAVLFARASANDVDRLSIWSREVGLLLVDTNDIRAFSKLRAERLIEAASARVPLADAENALLVAFRPLDGGDEHLAIIIGEPNIAEPVLVRLHSQCLTGDLLGSLRCDCGEQLRGAIRAISDQGGGVLIYLAQEGRDIGLINKLRAYTLQDLGIDTFDANEQLGFEADERIYAPATEILRQLGIKEVRLLTNNPDKMNQLTKAGVHVVERVSHIFPSNQHNAMYLKTKADKTGHLF